LEKNKEKGMLKYIINFTINITFIMCIWGILFKINKLNMFGYDQSQTMLIALMVGVILGLILSLMRWVEYNNRYNKLKEKVENDNKKLKF